MARRPGLLPGMDRQSLTVLLLFGLLAVAVVLRGASTPMRPFDPTSRDDTGLLALGEWLAEMGHPTATTGRQRFDLPEEPGLLFVYPGAAVFTEEELDELFAWVENGAVLVLAGPADARLQGRLGVDTELRPTTENVRQAQPLLPEGPVTFSVQPGRGLRLEENAAAMPVLIVQEDGETSVAAALERRGQGWVWVLSERFLLTNRQLSDEKDAARLVPALLRGVEPGRPAIFDTYHLYGPDPQATAGVRTLQDWLYRTPTGWATLFLLVLGGVYLLLQGRRLGPPLQVETARRRREASEFVVAMAGLQQRIHVRDSIARHHRRRLKQALGKPWRISPDLPDPEFLAALRSQDMTLSDERFQRIAQVLNGLRDPTDDRQLVELVASVDELLKG